MVFIYIKKIYSITNCNGYDLINSFKLNSNLELLTSIVFVTIIYKKNVNKTINFSVTEIYSKRITFCKYI